MNPKEFFKKWKEGIRTLPPEAQLKAKKIGIQGTIVGMIFGFTILAFRGMWYFLIMGFFITWLQVLQLISTNQQLENIKRVNEMMEENEDDKIR